MRVRVVPYCVKMSFMMVSAITYAAQTTPPEQGPFNQQVTPLPQAPSVTTQQTAQPDVSTTVVSAPVTPSPVSEPVPSLGQPSSVPTPGQMPAAPTPVTQPTAPQEPEVVGLTTAHLQEPSGNWLAKRGWWERAKDLYGKIRKTTDQAFDQRMVFFNKRTELDRTLFDPFYIHAGLGRGELQELLNYLMGQMEEQRTKEGVLSEADRDFLGMLMREKQTLEQLKLDIEAITKLDNSIDDALSKLMEQLNSARRYEQKAWEDFKAIADVLNDKKARELYYAMVTYDENIAAINNYIKNDLGKYFDQLTQVATEHVNRIKGMLQSLKEKGVDFQKKAKELEAQDSQTEKARRERERQEEEEERERSEQEAASGWFGWVTRGLSSIWDAVTGVFSGAYSTVRGWFVSDTESTSSDEAEPRPASLPPAPRVALPPPDEKLSEQGGQNQL